MKQDDTIGKHLWVALLLSAILDFQRCLVGNHSRQSLIPTRSSWVSPLGSWEIAAEPEETQRLGSLCGGMVLWAPWHVVPPGFSWRKYFWEVTMGNRPAVFHHTAFGSSTWQLDPKNQRLGQSKSSMASIELIKQPPTKRYIFLLPGKSLMLLVASSCCHINLGNHGIKSTGLFVGWF